MSSPSNHIIVPVDFSEQSKIALSQSYNLARFSKANITLVHVIDEALFTSILHYFKEDKIQEELLLTGIQTQLKELALEAKAKSGIDLKVRIERGKVYDEIIKVAEELDPSFIIMGTSGPTSFRKKFIGSNAERVIKEAKCPVITIKGRDHRTGCNTIVLPLDLTKETKEKTVQCVQIAQFFNSVVKIVSVIDTSDEYLVNKLQRQMEQVIDYIGSHNIICSGEFIKADSIAEGIIEYSIKVNADLIIIMTQQEIDWTLHFIGNESQQIINNSDIPVCSIRPVLRKDTSNSILV